MGVGEDAFVPSEILSPEDGEFPFFLRDEDVGVEARQAFVGEAFLAAVRLLGAGREDFDDEGRRVAVELVLPGWVAVHHDVGEVKPVVSGVVDVGLHVVHEGLALFATEMDVEVCEDVSGDAIVLGARAAHHVDFASEILVAVLLVELPLKVSLGAHPDFVNAYGAHDFQTVPEER